MNVAIRGLAYFIAYMAAILLPLIVAAALDPLPNPRPFGVELGVGFGFIAFSLVVTQFALVGRLRGISSIFGNDALMYFHKYMGLLALGLLIAHALMLAPGGFQGFNPFSGNAAVRTGALALWLMLALTLTTLFRRFWRIHYGTWLLGHLFAALAIGAAAVTHVLASRGYVTHPVMKGLILAYFAAFLLPVFRYRVWARWRMLRRPWTLIENRDDGADVRTLVLKPMNDERFAFEPGQFAWLATGHPALNEQHPISISSSAEQRPGNTVEFSIKNLGDWSGTVVPALQPGHTVFVDGPFGVFSLDRHPAMGFGLIAGGIGITPLLSMLLTMRDRDDRRPVVLFYAAHDWTRVVFRKELESLSRTMSLSLVWVFEQPDADWAGERGFMTTQILQRHLPAQYRRFRYFMCGPTPMLDAVESQLHELGVEPSRLQSERFDIV